MAKREFKIGDKVRIRQWDDMEQEFGLNEVGSINCDYDFCRDMEYLCGIEALVLGITEEGFVDLYVDSSIELDEWTITTDMLELVEE